MTCANLEKLFNLLGTQFPDKIGILIVPTHRVVRKTNELTAVKCFEQCPARNTRLFVT